ncbi:MAG: hypothetical protein ACI9S9_004053 [Planctomycetota bacterium]|jgi:hypothetical protein
MPFESFGHADVVAVHVARRTGNPPSRASSCSTSQAVPQTVAHGHSRARQRVVLQQNLGKHHRADQRWILWRSQRQLSSRRFGTDHMPAQRQQERPTQDRRPPQLARFRRRQITGFASRLPALASVLAIAEGLVGGEPATTQRDRVTACQPVFLACRIANGHVAFDAQGAIIVNRDLCHRVTLAREHTQLALQLKPRLGPTPCQHAQRRATDLAHCDYGPSEAAPSSFEITEPDGRAQIPSLHATD